MAEHICHANVILARNLEMLVLAIRARKRYAPQARVVYECLDIHRMLLSNRLHGGCSGCSSRSSGATWIYC